MSKPRPIQTMPYAEHFADVIGGLPGGDLPWLRLARTQAIEVVRRLGLPTQRSEGWRYTSLKALAAENFTPANDREAPAAIAGLAATLDDQGASHRFVFVNGRLHPEWSPIDRLPAGIALLDLATAVQSTTGTGALLQSSLEGSDEALTALNAAFASDGFAIEIAPGAQLAEPIELCFVNTAGRNSAVHYRNAILAGAGSSATIIETYIGHTDRPYWTHPVGAVLVEEGASLRHYKLQDESDHAIHLAANTVRVAGRGRYESFVLTTGASLSRHEATVTLDGEDASCRLCGVYLARGRQHVDNTTVIIHAAPRTACEEVFKGALDEQARGVFQGKIVVRPGAQKSDGHQLNKTVLLSDRAEMNTKPELEINADDVKCSHGAAVGDLDTEALFYLRARGIDATQARQMLVEGFLAETLEKLSDERVRIAFTRRVHAWMNRAIAGSVAPEGGA